MFPDWLHIFTRSKQLSAAISRQPVQDSRTIAQIRLWCLCSENFLICVVNV